MKKFLALLLVMMLIMTCFTACGSKDEAEGETPDTNLEQDVETGDDEANADADTEADAEQENDEEALALLKEYSDVRTRLGAEIQKGDVSEERIAEIREELEEAYSKMTTNDTITAYINAQRTFQAVIDQMNNILSFHITGKIPGGCSGNCSSCNSCG